MAIILHYFYDFKVFEIAEILGKPNNTIKMHLHRGRKAIRLEAGGNDAKVITTKGCKTHVKRTVIELSKAIWKYTCTL